MRPEPCCCFGSYACHPCRVFGPYHAASKETAMSPDFAPHPHYFGIYRLDEPSRQMVTVKMLFCSTSDDHRVALMQAVSSGVVTEPGSYLVSGLGGVRLLLIVESPAPALVVVD